MRKPVLIVQGANDGVVKSSVVARHKADLPHAQVQWMADAGHGAFWDDAEGFNHHLRAFAGSL
jgi:pimeloyl-ACP methyl ester carboxylesterase